MEEQLKHIQILSVALTGATNREQVARAILATVCEALGANAGSVALFSEDGSEFETALCQGYPPEIVAKYRRYPVGTALPNADVARSGEPIFIETLRERDLRYPHLATGKVAGGRGALAAAPLIAEGRSLGAVLWSFPFDRLFSEAERTFLLTISHLGALAVKTLRSLEQWEGEADERKAQQGFRDAVEAAIPAGLTVIDMQGRQTYVTEKFCRMVGWTAEELVGCFAPYPYWPWEERESLAKAFTEALAGRVPAGGFELRLGRKDGERFDARVHPAPFCDSQGVQVGWLASVTDVTEQVQAQKALRESEARFKALFDVSRDAVGISVRGRILYVNAAYARMMGFETPEEMVGRASLSMVTPDDIPRLAEMARRRAHGEPGTNVYEFRARRKDGTEIAVENRVSSYEHANGDIYTLVISRDVTERNRRIKAQRFLVDAGKVLSSSLDYEATLRNVAQLAVPHLADWCVVHLVDINGEMKQVAISHSDPDKVALAWEVGSRYPPDPNASIGVYAVLRSGKSEYLNDIPEELIRRAAKDEDHLRILLETRMRSYLCVALTAQEKRLGTITFVSAESGHHYGPEDLSLAEELAQRAALAVDNARLYQAEQTARREAESAAIHLRQAMTETHHRLKNNLQVIASLIDMRLGEHEKAVPRTELERLSAHVQTLAALHDLLTQQARLDSTAQSVSVRLVLERVVALNETAASPRLIRIKAGDVDLTTRQATGLALVLNELISNSIKHGKGRILAEFTTGNPAVLKVSDEGPGFPVDFRPDPNRSTGLELVDMIVRWDLGGDVEYGCHEEGGALVSVTFPID